MTNLFVILDENGVMLNRVKLKDEIMPYAGYGAYVAYEGGENPPEIYAEEPWIYLDIKPDASMAQGDSMDILTGEVTRKIKEVFDAVEPNENIGSLI